MDVFSIRYYLLGNSSDNDLKRKTNSLEEFSSDSGYSKRQKTTSTENESETDALKLVQRIKAAVSKRRPSSSSCKSADESDDIDIVGDEPENTVDTKTNISLQGPNNSAATATAAAHAAIAAAIATKQQQVQQQQQAIAAILARSRASGMQNPFQANFMNMNQMTSAASSTPPVGYGLQNQMIQNFLAQQQQHR